MTDVQKVSVKRNLIEAAAIVVSILTAYNSYSQKTDAQANERRQSQLKEMLENLNLTMLPVTSSNGGGECLIFSISYEKAKAFGTCFQQSLILFGEPNEVAELIFCD